MTTISSTDSESRNIFTIPVLQALPPFTGEAPHLKTVDIVDSAQNLDIAYQHPVTMMAAMKLPQTKRSSPTSESFSVNADHVNIRVSGVDRLKIPGSFKVHLLKDDKVIASKAVFQPTAAAACENCAKNAHAHFDFELPLAMVADGKLGVRVEPSDKSFVGDKFPDKLMGNPSVDVRLMLRNE